MTTSSYPTFQVGDGATSVRWTDRHAGTIIEASPKRVVWQRDRAILLNAANSGQPDALKFTPGGFVGHTSGTQRHEYAPDPEGRTETYTLRRNGRWVRKRCGMNERGASLIPGRHEHYDFNF